MATVSLTSFQGLRAVRSKRSPLALSASQRSNGRFSMAASLPVLTYEGEKAGDVELDLKVAKPETAKAVVHRAVITQLQNRRKGTASTKTRAEVRGGGRKPYKQKGTGNARIGSTRTPLRPGGGVVFGPKPKDWTIKINKKENRLALSTALQSAAQNMTVVEDFSDKIEAPNTKEFVTALKRWGVDYKADYALLFTAELSQAVELSARNIKKFKVLTPRTLNIYDILRADKLIVTKSGIDYLTTRYSDEGFDGLYVVENLIKEFEAVESVSEEVVEAVEALVELSSEEVVEEVPAEEEAEEE